jgi:CHASE3 domain sensor protein
MIQAMALAPESKEKLKTLAHRLRVMSAYLEPQATQRGSLTELDQVLNAKMGEMQFALDAFDREGFEAAKMVIKTNRGAQQMQHVRYLMDVIRAREQGVLKQGVLPLPF